MTYLANRVLADIETNLIIEMTWENWTPFEATFI